MIVLRGLTEFKAAVDLKVERMRRATLAATAKALHLIEKRAKEKLGQTSHRKGEPTPSNPGDPPSLVTGNLRRFITVEGPTPVTPNSWRGSVGPTAIYGRVQELGGPTHHADLPARPYLEPSLEELQDEIRELFIAAWRAAILE